MTVNKFYLFLPPRCNTPDATLHQLVEACETSVSWQWQSQMNKRNGGPGPGNDPSAARRPSKNCTNFQKYIYLYPFIFTQHLAGGESFRQRCFQTEDFPLQGRTNDHPSHHRKRLARKTLQSIIQQWNKIACNKTSIWLKLYKWEPATQSIKSWVENK